ncbi:MAG: hypothetical protein J2P24_19955, partial [Streptosporangiales bacterium]|nr:hypothetical protein [Streptosporangiales bacterium]
RGCCSPSGDALLPVLRAAAFSMTATRTRPGFGAEENQREVDERREWPVGRLARRARDGLRRSPPRRPRRRVVGSTSSRSASGSTAPTSGARSASLPPYNSDGAADALVLLVEPCPPRRARCRR